MRISNMNNYNNKNIAFSGGSIYEDAQEIKKQIKMGIKQGVSAEVMKGHLEKLSDIEKAAKNQLTAKDKRIPRIFNALVKWFGKVKVDKTGNKALDSASRLTRIVLWGNVGKEAVGTALYTVQALTNKDLPEEKRKYIGMYDLAVGVVSTMFSIIFGVGLEKSIKNSYKKVLKPLSSSNNPLIRSKTAAAIVGLAAFSSFFLQTIIGKRIIAPAIAVPAAGKLRTWMENKEKEKHPEKFEKTAEKTK